MDKLREKNSDFAIFDNEFQECKKPGSSEEDDDIGSWQNQGLGSSQEGDAGSSQIQQLRRSQVSLRGKN